MRFRGQYRAKPGPGAQTPSSIHSAYSSPVQAESSLYPEDVAQPFGALSLPPPTAQMRNPRILRLLWWTLPLVIVTTLAGIGLIVLTLWSQSTAHATSQGDAAQAHVAYEQQEWLTRHFPQPWLAQYNLGTVLVETGDIDGGLAFLTRSFEGVPKASPQENGQIGAFSYECSVRFNVAGAMEMQGDEAVAAQDDKEAVRLYESALEWVSPCQVIGAGGATQDSQGGGGTPEEQENQQVNPELEEQTGEASDRLQEKIDDLREGESGTDQGTSEGEGSTAEGQEESGNNGEAERVGETAQERERREELEQKNREQQEYQREQEESHNRNPGTGGW